MLSHLIKEASCQVFINEVWSGAQYVGQNIWTQQIVHKCLRN